MLAPTSDSGKRNSGSSSSSEAGHSRKSYDLQERSGEHSAYLSDGGGLERASKSGDEEDKSTSGSRRGGAKVLWTRTRTAITERLYRRLSSTLPGASQEKAVNDGGRRGSLQVYRNHSFQGDEDEEATIRHGDGLVAVESPRQQATREDSVLSVSSRDDGHPVRMSSSTPETPKSKELSRRSTPDTKGTRSSSRQQHGRSKHECWSRLLSCFRCCKCCTTPKPCTVSMRRRSHGGHLSDDFIEGPPRLSIASAREDPDLPRTMTLQLRRNSNHECDNEWCCIDPFPSMMMTDVETGHSTAVTGGKSGGSSAVTSGGHGDSSRSDMASLDASGELRRRSQGFRGRTGRPVKFRDAQDSPTEDWVQHASSSALMIAAETDDSFPDGAAAGTPSKARGHHGAYDNPLFFGEDGEPQACAGANADAISVISSDSSASMATTPAPSDGTESSSVETVDGTGGIQESPISRYEAIGDGEYKGSAGEEKVKTTDVAGNVDGKKRKKRFLFKAATAAVESMANVTKRSVEKGAHGFYDLGHTSRSSPISTPQLQLAAPLKNDMQDEDEFKQADEGLIAGVTGRYRRLLTDDYVDGATSDGGPVALLRITKEAQS